jgi:hypothetical protein
MRVANRPLELRRPAIHAPVVTSENSAESTHGFFGADAPHN